MASDLEAVVDAEITPISFITQKAVIKGSAPSEISPVDHILTWTIERCTCFLSSLMAERRLHRSRVVGP